MKEVTNSIIYREKELGLVFNLNVLEEIQNEYGTLDKWVDLVDGENGKEPNIKALKFGFTQMLNEAIEIENDEKGTNKPLFTLKEVGRIITEIGLQDVNENIKDTFVASTESAEKNA